VSDNTEYGPRDKPMTAKQLAHWWAVEAAAQKRRAEAAEAICEKWRLDAEAKERQRAEAAAIADKYILRCEELLKRAEAAEADARDVRAWADAVPVEAMLALIGPDDYDFTGLLSDLEEFSTWLEAQRALRAARR
jgi:hypothetical protein